MYHESFNGSAPLLNTVGAWKNTKYGRKNPLNSEQKKIRDRVILITNYFTNFEVKDMLFYTKICRKKP